MRTRQKQRSVTDNWRSLGCWTTPLEHWSKRKSTVEPRWAEQQTTESMYFWLSSNVYSVTFSTLTFLSDNCWVLINFRLKVPTSKTFIDFSVSSVRSIVYWAAFVFLFCTLCYVFSFFCVLTSVFSFSISSLVSSLSFDCWSSRVCSVFPSLLYVESSVLFPGVWLLSSGDSNVSSLLDVTSNIS